MIAFVVILADIFLSILSIEKRSLNSWKILKKRYYPKKCNFTVTFVTFFGIFL